MSKSGKFALLFAGLCAVAVVVARVILSGWISALWAPLGVAILLFSFAVIKDFRLLMEFFTMRTTKNGMNMGGLILTVVVLLIAVNVIAVQQERKWDWTIDRLNSLSEQSTKALAALTSDVELVLLMKPQPGDEQLRKQVEDVASLYSGASKRFSFASHSVYERNDLAKKFGYQESDGPYALYLSQAGGERQLKVDQASEEEITRTLLRLTREKKKTVYFVTGHGELQLETKGPESIEDFKKDLELAYDVKALELFKDPKVPDDADLVVIAGPRQEYLAPEIEALRSYGKRGGTMLIALDPDGKHGLASLTKAFGIEFQNDFVLDPRAMIPGAGNIAAVGSEFSSTAEATRALRDGFSLFLVASSLKRAPEATKDFKVEELVKTDERAIAASELSGQAKVQTPGPHVVAMESRGKLAGAEKEFAVVVFGDSDFLRANIYRKNLNRDLAMNTVAALAKDTDLISIRPRLPKGTELSMSQTQLMIVLFGFLLPVPIAMFFASGLLWWRRKSA